MRENGQMLIVLRDPCHYSDAVLTLTPAAALTIQMLDGTHTLLDIQAALTRAAGQIFPSDKIQELVRILDDCFFLDNDRFDAHKRRCDDEFSASPIRPSAMAGKSYPADPSEVRALLDGLFAQSAPSGLLSTGENGPVVGVVSPHIDFARGGTTYTPAYRALAESDAETYVIFGISHAGGETPLIPTRKDFQTPLGRVEADHEILDLLEKNLIARDGWPRPYAAEFAHAHEHSIEFQVVFLQHLRPSRPFRILPILCAFSHEEVHAESDRTGPIRVFLDALRVAIEQSGRRVGYIAGVDFAHVGAQFGDTYQVKEKELAFLKERDEQMMALIASDGPEAFHRFVFEEANSRRVCGYPALYSFLSVLPPAAARGGQVLKYGQWPDPNGTVTFGSMAFSADA